MRSAVGRPRRGTASQAGTDHKAVVGDLRHYKADGVPGVVAQRVAPCHDSSAPGWR